LRVLSISYLKGQGTLYLVLKTKAP